MTLNADALSLIANIRYSFEMVRLSNANTFCGSAAHAALSGTETQNGKWACTWPRRQQRSTFSCKPMLDNRCSHSSFVSACPYCGRRICMPQGCKVAVVARKVA